MKRAETQAKKGFLGEWNTAQFSRAQGLGVIKQLFNGEGTLTYVFRTYQMSYNSNVVASPC